MKDQIFQIFSLVNSKVRQRGPAVFKSWLNFKIRLPIVVILIIFFFWLGVRLSGSFINGTDVEKATLNYNQSFENIKVLVSEAHLTRTVRVSQKNAPAPDGKKYLVLFTTVENASSSASQLNYGDFFRLEEDSKKLAPLPINTTFVAPPKATLDKQLIFLVDQGKKVFNLLIGPLDQEPQRVEVHF